MAITAGREPATSTTAGGAREALIPLSSAAGWLAGALAAVAATAAAATVFVPGVLRGPAVMNGSARGTAAELAIAGCSGVIPVRRDGDVAVVPLAAVLEQRRVPRELYELTRLFG